MFLDERSESEPSHGLEHEKYMSIIRENHHLSLLVSRERL